MSRVDFYHLQTQRLEDVLPKLLEKAYATGNKIAVKIGNDERVDFLNALLWTYNDTSFLPHGSRKDGSGELQPIWLTAGDDVPNDAKFLFLVDGARCGWETMQQFERVFNIFDGNAPESLTQARQMWKELKQQNADIFYWQQNDNGSWQQKG